jgi:hypothetical protein
VSGGERKVSGQGESTGGPASQSTRSPGEAQNGDPLFLVPSRRAMGFLLRVHGPYRCLRDGYCIQVCRLRLFGLSSSVSSTTVSLLRYFLRPTTAMARKNISVDELNAHAEANGYQRGAHREEDSRRDCNKHVDKIKQDQNAALDRYVL